MDRGRHVVAVTDPDKGRLAVELTAPQAAALVLVAAVDEFRASRQWEGAKPWAVPGSATAFTRPTPECPAGAFTVNKLAVYALARMKLVTTFHEGTDAPRDKGYLPPVLTDHGRRVVARWDETIRRLRIRPAGPVEEAPPAGVQRP